MTLDSFSFLILFSYLIGTINFHSISLDEIFKRLKGSTSNEVSFQLPYSPFFILIADFGKGASAVLIARLLVGSSVAMVLGGLSVILGHSLPVFRGSERRKCIIPALGAIMIISPLVFFFLSGATIFSIILTKYLITGPITISILLPLSFWYFKRYDLYTIYGVITSTIIIYQFIPDIEEWVRGQSVKISKSELLEALVRLQSPNHNTSAKQVVVLRTILLLSVISVGGLLFLNRYVYRGFGMQVEIFRRGNPQLQYIAITFDDGPDPIYTPLILDILKENDIKATFFLVGKHVQANPEIARRIVAEGHEIGNHTYSHRNLFGLAKEKILEEIEMAEEIILNVTGERPYLFRPPRGLYNQAVLDILKERQYTLVLWSQSSRDWMEISPASVRRYTLNNLLDGAILLFHDSGSIIASEGGDRYNTVKALPLIIQEIRKRGYIPVTITELSISAGLTGSEE